MGRALIEGARYVHTNLVARDWRSLARFYAEVFGCVVLERGGSEVGEIVTLALSTGAKVTWCYVRDPEGNLVELQSWA